MHALTDALRPALGRRPVLALAAALLALGVALVVAHTSTPVQLSALSVPAVSLSDAPPAPVVANAGQTDPRVRFEARAGGGAAFFTPREVVLARPAGVVRLRFPGGAARPALRGTDPTTAVVRDARAGGGATALRTYGGVAYRDLWPGIEVRLDARATAAGPWVAPRFVIAPGADPRAVALRFAGVASAGVDRSNGELRVLPRGGRRAIAWPAPVAWQLAGDGRRLPVDMLYRVDEDGTIGLAPGRYDPRRALIVGAHPHARAAQAKAPELVYSTYFGASKWDEAYDVDVDKAGNAYVAGFTFSPEFPVKGSGPKKFEGVQDAFVARFSSKGELRFSTILGGSGVDVGQNVAVDKSGNSYVTGRTLSDDFPTKSALQDDIRGEDCQGAPCPDAFVTKVNRSGAVVYSTFFGGSGSEEGWGIAVDAHGSAYIAGNTDSADLPTHHAVQSKNRSRGCGTQVPCPLDTFVTKLSPSGRSIDYSTYLGGKGGEVSGGITVDSSGSAYASGTTRSEDFPTKNARQPKIAGKECGPPPGFPCTDVFLTKLSSSGSSIVYSTYFGGTKNDRSAGVAVDKQKRPYLTGSTESPNLPLQDAVQDKLGNSSCGETEPKELCDDAFVSGLGSNGRDLRFSTFLGGNAEDQSLGVAVDSEGAIYVGGSTDSRAFRTVEPLQPKLGGAIDAFAAKFAPGGKSLVFSTFVGGSENERFSGLAVDESGAVTLAGRSDSPNFPTAAAEQGKLGGDIDAVVTKLK